jgi:hypothetical protein
MKAISGFPHAACRCYRPSEHAGTPGKARSCKYHRPAANLGQKGGHPVDVGLILLSLSAAAAAPAVPVAATAVPAAATAAAAAAETAAETAVMSQSVFMKVARLPLRFKGAEEAV